MPVTHHYNRPQSWLDRLVEPYALIWSHRELLLQVVLSTLRQRYAGTVLGVTWLLLAPSLLLTSHIFMFVVVFGVRAPGMDVAGYVAHICCGLILFLTLGQALTSATTALTQEPGLLFNRVFPAELFPIREVLAACPLLAVGALVAPIWAAVSGTLSWNWLLLPLLLAFFLMTVAGWAWLLSLANLVVRDTPQIVAYILTLLMLTSPIAYVPSMLPAGARPMIDLNPFAYPIRAAQEIVVGGATPDPWLLIGTLIVAVASFHGGYGLFRRGKSVIAETL